MLSMLIKEEFVRGREQRESNAARKDALTMLFKEECALRMGQNGS